MKIRTKILLFAAAFLFAITGLLSANEKAASGAAIDASAPAILIRNATILTVSHGTIDKGDILIKDGKIAAVGGTLNAPPDAVVIDATGQFVTPGIVDCHSHIAVDGSVNEGSVSVSSMVNIADVLNSDDIAIYRDLAGGVTTAVTARLYADGRISADETTVVCITGNGLKTTDALTSQYAQDRAVRPRLTDFAEYLEELNRVPSIEASEPELVIAGGPLGR